MNDNQCAAAYTHIRNEIPALDSLICATGEVALPAMSGDPVADVMVEIVVGQMLSRSAAQSILGRMRTRADLVKCGPLYNLSDDELRACGLSGRKAKTISLIADMVRTEPERLESWRSLHFDDLRREVSSVWGLSDWSASMLGIFHFGQPDVFPLSDGSLVRAIRLIDGQHTPLGDGLPFEAASPYRSYLALTLWAALDGGHLASNTQNGAVPTER